MSQKQLQRDAEYLAYRWWQRMFLSPTELKAINSYPAPTAFKAQLRRCNNIDAAMLSEGFRDLWLSLPEGVTKEAQPESIEAWAAVAAALVFVKADSKTKLAAAAGKKGDGDKSVVSELRFAQLQNSKTPDEFLVRLRRVLQQINGQVSVQALISDIHRWFNEYYSFRSNKAANRLAVNWAMDYYQAAQ